jgi:predicted AlkP superfamily pyrophosphatase or phosphodiesterase
MDRMTLELASTTIEEGQLGQDATPDVLAIGLSVMDLVAHYYGPYSVEVMDHLLRVDDYLMAFLNRLDQQVGLDNVVIAMSSDHGGLPLPEHWTQIMGRVGGRVDEPLYLATRVKAYAEIDSIYGSHDFIHRKGSSYYFDPTKMDSMGVDQDVVNEIMQRYMESVEGIHRLYSREELLAADGSDFRTARLKNFTHPTLSPDLYTEVEHGWIYRNPFGTSHHTPYDYDSDVPFLVASSNRQAMTITSKVATVDIAPTLADILGITPTEVIDGKSLLPFIKP